jgi:hypothetical protein
VKLLAHRAIMLFTALQLPDAPADRPLRAYTLHCPGHDELVTTTLTLEKADDSEDAQILGQLIATLRRATIASGVKCEHTPRGWR